MKKRRRGANPATESSLQSCAVSGGTQRETVRIRHAAARGISRSFPDSPVSAKILIGVLPMDTPTCPNCKDRTVVPGHFTYDVVPMPSFIPTHTIGPGVSLTRHFHSCFSCGHIWSDVDPEKLRSYITAHGDELMKERLEPCASDPFRGLPDCPEAHDAARGVAEIDDLVFTGKMVEAIRRYRELTHTKWGPAGDYIRAWRNLKRAQARVVRLALKGRVARRKSCPRASDARSLARRLAAIPVGRFRSSSQILPATDRVMARSQKLDRAA